MRASERSSQRFYAGLGGADGLAALTLPAKTRADIALARRWCEAARDVLDLGCGYGRIAIPLARGSRRVRGIDLDPALIRAARREARRIGAAARFDLGSMLDLPYADASFDRVLCLWSSFSHLITRRDQLRALAEMRRVLRPGGRAIVETTDAGDAATRRRLAREGRGPDRRVAAWRIHGAPITLYLHDRGSLAALCAGAGFAAWRVTAPRVNGNRRLVAVLRR